MDRPLISIVLTTYNSENTVSDVLDSIAKQDFPLSEIELVVVDGGSRDRTLEVVKSFLERHGPIFHGARLIVHERNYGVSRARNDGIRASRGRYILVLDHDVIMGESTLANLYRFLENSPQKVAAVIPLHVNHTEGTLDRWARLIREGKITRASAITSCALVRREAVESIGLYDETLGPPFTVVEDTEYCARAKSKGYMALVLGYEKVLHVDERTWEGKHRLRDSLLRPRKDERGKGAMLMSALRGISDSLRSIKDPMYRYAYRKYAASLPFPDRVKWYCYGITALLIASLIVMYCLLGMLGIKVPTAEPLALILLVTYLALYMDILKEYWNPRVFHISLVYSAIALTWRTLRSLMLLMPAGIEKQA